jgi:hypothetical protein
MTSPGATPQPVLDAARVNLPVWTMLTAGRKEEACCQELRKAPRRKQAAPCATGDRKCWPMRFHQQAYPGVRTCVAVGFTGIPGPSFCRLPTMT